MEAPFANRQEAGLRLAAALHEYASHDDAIVLGLPRGGVPVAYALAQQLRLPLDVFMVRKLGLPGFEELALGAIASGGVCVLNDKIVAGLPGAAELIKSVAAREFLELQRRESLYRNDRPPPQLQGHVVIVVDDGLATGASMRAAVAALRRNSCARIIVAIPVAPTDTCRDLRQQTDELICLIESDSFRSVGEFYEDFTQVDDDEVRGFLLGR